jgi:hypothetical protein
MAVPLGYKQTSQHIARRAASTRRGRWFRCLICNKSFWRKPYAIANGDIKFCSRKCYFKHQKGKPKPIRNRRSYRGSANPNWKGGIAGGNRAVRRSNEFVAWRSSVFERDNWTCQKCRRRSKKNRYLRIEAHHVKPFATFPELRFVIDNGLTLCKRCHDKEPKGLEIYSIK